MKPVLDGLISGSLSNHSEFQFFFARCCVRQKPSHRSRTQFKNQEFKIASNSRYIMLITFKTRFAKIINLEVSDDETVEQIKQRIRGTEGLPILQEPDHFFLIYDKKTLANGETLKSYGITEEATIMIAERMRT